MSNKKEKRPAAGLYISDVFRFERKLYGVLKSVDNKKFIRYVEITLQTATITNWMTLSPTMEEAVRYFFERKFKK